MPLQEYCPDQSELFRLELVLPGDHVINFIAGVVDEWISLNSLEVKNTGKPGVHPGNILKLILWSICCGARSFRQIEEISKYDLTFKYVSRNSSYNFRTIWKYCDEHKSTVLECTQLMLDKMKKGGVKKLYRLSILHSYNAECILNKTLYSGRKKAEESMIVNTKLLT